MASIERTAYLSLSELFGVKVSALFGVRGYFQFLFQTPSVSGISSVFLNSISGDLPLALPVIIIIGFGYVAQGSWVSDAGHLARDVTGQPPCW